MEPRCKCGCDKHRHSMDGEVFRCSQHSVFKCKAYELDDLCICGHYKTSHDVWKRCHAYIKKEPLKMCECNLFEEGK